jgi:ubiquinone/menaquinone biosynthesis C-methylase UbiE
LKIPLYYKYDLPIYVKKSDNKIRADKYEHFYPTILRNLLIHCGDELWENYPFQPVRDFVVKNISSNSSSILEIGCGLGRLISEVAFKYPKATCYGIDYSLHMLKFAHKMWIKGEAIEIDGSDMGFHQFTSPSLTLSNLHFAMASASNLPFEDKKIDMILASFILDKLDDLEKTIKEAARVLVSSGQLIIISPFNMEKRQMWKTFYPVISFETSLESYGFKLETKEKMTITEPIDRHGNAIHWKCIAFVYKKN